MTAAEIDEHITRRYDIKRRLGEGVSFTTILIMCAERT
jgi:hypothetical protein